MTLGFSGGMGSEEDKKKLNDDLVVFMGQRTQTEAHKYSPRLQKYVELQQKRSRAANARSNASRSRVKKNSNSRKTAEGEPNDDPAENTHCPANEEWKNRKRNGGEQKCMHHKHSISRSGSRSPSDRCGRRKKRRRRRSRRRRRRSCGRRRGRRRRSRRRRRRSCRRRRRRRRRRRC